MVSSSMKRINSYFTKFVGHTVPNSPMTWDTMLLAISIALLPLFHLTVKNWTEAWLVILALVSGYGIWQSGVKFSTFFPDRATLWIFASLTFPIVAVFLSILIRGDLKWALRDDNLDLLNGPSRLFLAGVAFLWMNYKKVNFVNCFQIISSIGIIITVFFATTQQPGNPDRYTTSLIDLDSFSQQICLLGLVQFLFLLFRPSASPLVSALTIVSILLAAKMGIASGGRGGWIAVPPILIFAAFCYKGKKSKLLALIFFILLTLGALLATNKVFYDRLMSIYSESKDWISGGSGGSGGHRIGMWAISWELIKQNPIKGYGSKQNLWGPVYQMDPSLYLRKGISYEDEERSRYSLCHTGEHSEYFHEFVANGIFGFSAKILLLLVPLIVFITRLKNTHRHCYATNVIGIGFVAAFMIFGITQGPFGYKFICSFYGFVIGGLAIRPLEAQSPSKS